MIKNIFLFALSIFISFLFIELCFINFFPQEKNDSWRVQGRNGVYFNIKNKKAKHEFFGKKDKISVEYNFGNFANRILVNKKQKNQNKILLMGDSFIFGWLVEDSDTIQNKLQNYFTDFEVINGSAGGFSDSDQLIYLKEFCDEIKPEYIIFFTEIDRNFRNKIFQLGKNNELIEGQIQKNKLKEKLNSSTIYHFCSRNFHFFNFLKKQYVKNKSNLKINPKTNLEKDNKNDLFNQDEKHEKQIILTKLIFQEIIKETKLCKSKIFFVNIYWFKKSGYSKIKNYVYENFNEFIKNEEEILYTNLENEMNILLDNRNYFFYEEGHPNKYGTNIISEILIAKFKKFNLQN